MNGFIACDISEFFCNIMQLLEAETSVTSFALCWKLGVYCKSQVAKQYAHTHTPSPRYTAKANGYYLGTYIQTTAYTDVNNTSIDINKIRNRATCTTEVTNPGFKSCAINCDTTNILHLKYIYTYILITKHYPT